MFKTFVSACILAAASAQAEDICAVCWDGSEAVFTDNSCVCPAPVLDEPEPVDEEPLEANPNCTTGNSKACNQSGGFFDFNDCTCSYAPIAPEWPFDDDNEEWEPEWDDDLIDEFWAEWMDLKRTNKKYGTFLGLNALLASTFDGAKRSKKSGKKDSKYTDKSSKRLRAKRGGRSAQDWDISAVDTNMSYWFGHAINWFFANQFGWGIFEMFERWDIRFMPISGLIHFALIAFGTYEGASGRNNHDDLSTYFALAQFMFSFGIQWKWRPKMQDYIAWKGDM